MKRSLLFGLLVLLPFMATRVNGQGDDFKTLWQRYEKGENVVADLRGFVANQQGVAKDRFNATYLLAVIDIVANKLDQALQDLADAEKIQPGTAQVLVRRAEVRLLQKNYKKARQDLAKSVKLIGRKTTDLRKRQQIILARLEGKTGQAKKGVQKLLKLARKHKKDAEIHFFLGHLFETMDKPKDALKHYNKAIKYMPTRDPAVAVYAYQRWAAIAVSSDGGSYGNPKLLKQAITRYEQFLKRAPANGVPKKLQDNVRSTVGTLGHFLKTK